MIQVSKGSITTFLDPNNKDFWKLLQGLNRPAIVDCKSLLKRNKFLFGKTIYLYNGRLEPPGYHVYIYIYPVVFRYSSSGKNLLETQHFQQRCSET